MQKVHKGDFLVVSWVIKRQVADNNLLVAYFFGVVYEGWCWQLDYSDLVFG